MSVWQAPSGRLHWSRNCSGGISPRTAKRVTVGREEFERNRYVTQEICPCLRNVTFEPGKKARN